MRFSSENWHLGLEGYCVPNFPWGLGGNRYIHVLVYSHPPCRRWMEERMLRMNRKHPLGILCCPGVVPLHMGTIGSILLMSPDVNGSKIYTHWSCIIDNWRALWCRGLPTAEQSTVSTIRFNRHLALPTQFSDLGHKITVISKVVRLSYNFLMINKWFTYFSKGVSL